MRQIFASVLLVAALFASGCSTVPFHSAQAKPPRRSLDIQKVMQWSGCHQVIRSLQTAARI